ncbi:MAG: rhodanese-like domain-containing protein, partial [Bacteroidota bacterium]
MGCLISRTRVPTQGAKLPSIPMNKEGYNSFSNVLDKGMVALTPSRFEEMVESLDALMLDTRSEEDFAREHIPNSIFIGIDGSFAPW